MQNMYGAPKLIHVFPLEIVQFAWSTIVLSGHPRQSYVLEMYKPFLDVCHADLVLWSSPIR